MTITNISKHFYTITVTENEVIDRNFFEEEIGQVTVRPIYFVGAGALQVSGNGTDFIAVGAGVAQNVLVPDIGLPQFFRITGAGTSTVYLCPERA